MGRPLLRFDEVSKNYGGIRALDAVSFTIKPGEIYGLLGPNGAGKTTALKLAVGLLKPTSGAIQLLGQDIANWGDDLGRVIGYLPDEPALYPKLTGREMLDLIAALRKIGPKDVDERFPAYAELLSFEAALLDRFMLTYSRGARRKFALILATLHDPSLLLLDEPTESLDPLATRNLQVLLGEMRSQGKGIVLATHNLVVAERLCDRVGLLDTGRLLFEGTMEEVRQSYAGERAKLEALFFEKLSTPHWDL